MVETNEPSDASQDQPQFESLNFIGKGGYGEVFLARDLSKNYWALKVIYRASFQEERPYEREFQGVAKYIPVSLRSDYLLKIIHVGKREGCFYYIMELADDLNRGRDFNAETYIARSLKAVRRPSERLSGQEAIRIALPLVRALIDLHDAGLIHRDIKPSNIIFVNGEAKLADLGLVTDLDQSISYVGTEGFIPQEGPISPQADIFALGKVIYEMISGRDRLEYPEMPTDLHEIPDRLLILELNAIVAKACQKSSQARYQTARDLCADLEFVAEGGSIRDQARRKHFTEKILRLAAIFVTMFLVIGAGLYVFPKWQRGREGGASAFTPVRAAVIPEAVAEKEPQTKVIPATPPTNFTAEDRTNNFVMGRNLCFLGDEWEQGIPYLARGSDEAIALAASAELSSGGQIPQWPQLAESWMTAAGGTVIANKFHCYRRARYWLIHALKNGNGVFPESAQRLMQARLAGIPIRPARLFFTGTSGFEETISIKRNEIIWSTATGQGFHSVAGLAGGLPPFVFTVRRSRSSKNFGLAETRRVLPEDVDFTGARPTVIFTNGRTSNRAVMTPELRDNELILNVHEQPGPKGRNVRGVFQFEITVEFRP